MDSHTCMLHGWKKRKDEANVKVLDTMLMSTELDLLEIRLHELDPVVDYFFIVESNATFTGLPKEAYFRNNKERFARFEHKIVYELYVLPSFLPVDLSKHDVRSLPGYPLAEGQDAWDVEAHTRDTMSNLLRSHMKTFSPSTQSLVLMADLDEIPSSHTVKLLKTCEFGEKIHLQLRNFMYRYGCPLFINSLMDKS